MKLTPIALAALLGAAPLAACSTSTPAANPSGTSTSPQPPSASPSPSRAAAPAPSASPSYIGRIGSSAVLLPTGIEVSVGEPRTYPDPSVRKAVSGIVRGGDLFAVVPITLTNNGTRGVDVSLTAVTITASGEQASPLGEPDRHPTDDHFQGTLLPGKTQRATFGYVLRQSDVGHLQVEVWPTSAEPHAILVDSDGTT